MKRKPWSMNIVMTIGLVVGVVLWLGRYDHRHAIFQNVSLIIVPIATSVVVVSFRNRRKRVGPFEPDTIARNNRGRV